MVKHSRTSFLLLKNLFRSLIKNWKQLISIIAISFLAICLFSGLTSNAKNLQERADYLYTQTNYADLYVTTTSLTQDEKSTITNYAEVDKVEERLYLPVDNGGSILYLVGASEDSTISTPLLIDGTRGLVLTDTYANNRGLKIGSTITLSIDSSYFSIDDNIKRLAKLFVREGKEDFLNSSKISIPFEITGLMYHPEAVQNSTFSLSTAYVDSNYLIKQISAAISSNYNLELIAAIYHLFGNDFDLENIIQEMYSKLTNQLVIKSSEPNIVQTKIQQLLSSGQLISCSLGTEMSEYKELKQECDQAMALTFVFPVIFFLVSVLVILTTLSQMIIKERSQIGALKAIGVPKYKIYAHYTLYGVVLCFIGALLGFFVGPLFIPNVLGIKYQILWDIPELPVKFFYPLTLLIVFIILVLSGLCAFLMSYHVIKEKPCDTLRPKVTIKKVKPVDSNSFFQKHSSIEFRMAIRNVFRNKGKSLMVILGTLGCSALLVCGFGIMDTLNYDISLDFNVNQSFDMVVVTDENKDEFLADVNDMTEVKRAESYYNFSVIASYESQVNTDMILLEENSDYFLIPVGVDDGVSIDATTAEQLGIKPGQELRVVMNGQVYNKKVTYVFESAFLRGIYDLQKNYPEELSAPSSYYINLNDGIDSAVFEEELMANFNILSMMSKEDVLKEADNILSTISTMTDIVKIFAILLSIVVIYNLTSLNIAERSRDIATMKVLGFRYKEISKTLTYEIMLDVLIGSLIGVFVGYPLMVLVLVVNQTNLLTFIYHIQWYTYLLAFVIAFAVSLLVSLVLNLKSKKINMTESLKSIE